ncbi:MAG: hypothetical protein D6726_12155 [Nitrospirae bacterium]|nr:MAG: hypothetical protein D6726_12155 [Nitrospirota bacterium]
MRWRRDREDKTTLTEPRCPFCRELFERPRDIPTELSFFFGGRCSCGAVYGCDPTGRNLGEVFADTLAFACGDDWEMASGLEEGEDYEVRELFYLPGAHRVLPGEMARLRQGVRARLIFVKIRFGGSRK